MISRRIFKVLPAAFWAASLASVFFILQGYYCKIHQLAALQIGTLSSTSAIENDNIPVTADMLDRLHALHFYPSNFGTNSSTIAQLNTPVSIDDRNVVSLKAVRGQVYNATWFAERSGYEVIRSESMDKYRPDSPIHNPKGCGYAAPNAWIGEFRNVYVGGSGDVYIPLRNYSSGTRTVDVVHYSAQGGLCCEDDWRIAVKEVRNVQVTRRCHHKLAFALVQNHGSTYSHLMYEAIPRFFSFLKVARGLLQRGGVIAVLEYPLLPQILQKYLGVESHQIVQIPSGEPCFFERVLMPEAYVQGTYPKDCVSAATDNVFKSLFLEPQPPPLPVILLMERAGRRYSNGKCAGMRCLANFEQLRKAIINEFGDKVVVETIGPSTKGGIRTTAKMFNRATVAVGVHGAGFANMMYMRKSNTHIIHLGWMGDMWDFYGKKAHARGINYVNVLSHRASQAGDNVHAEIPVILLEIRRALTKEGFALNPPIWKIDPRRSRDVVMRYP